VTHWGYATRKLSSDHNGFLRPVPRTSNLSRRTWTCCSLVYSDHDIGVEFLILCPLRPEKVAVFPHR
jgi:hypothetical protein